jgi:protoporphyrinogen IX oxidase
MLWIKSLHIFFVASWFAGLVYLPRLYVNLALENDLAASARLLTMARKLFRFMNIIIVPALGSGLWLWLVVGIGRGGAGWLHAKLAVVALLILHHMICGRLLMQFEQKNNRHRVRWYQIFNELPALGFLIIVILVVVKPF